MSSDRMPSSKKILNIFFQRTFHNLVWFFQNLRCILSGPCDLSGFKALIILDNLSSFIYISIRARS